MVVSRESNLFSLESNNLYSSTTIRWSIEIFKKKISDPWGGINVCDNSWQLGEDAQMQQTPWIIPSSLGWLQTKLCHRWAKRLKIWCCETFLGPQFRLLEEWWWINCRITVNVFCQQLKRFKSEACVSPWPHLHNKTTQQKNAPRCVNIFINRFPLSLDKTEVLLKWWHLKKLFFPWQQLFSYTSVAVSIPADGFCELIFQKQQKLVAGMI